MVIAEVTASIWRLVTVTTTERTAELKSADLVTVVNNITQAATATKVT